MKKFCMHTKLRRAAALLLVAALALGTTACSGTAGSSAGSSSTSGTSTAAKKNLYPGTSAADSVTLNLSNEPPELDSMLCTDTVSMDVLRMTMAGLTKQDKNDKPVADIAETWDISADKKTYTFHLRKDAKWSNGDPVTAHDFVFGWSTAMLASTASQYAYILTDNLVGAADYAAGKATADKLGVKALDDNTLQVKFLNPLPYALSLTAFSTYLPVNEKAFRKITNNGKSLDKYAKSPDTIVTDGAYKITEWTHNDHISLVKNDSYWDAKNIFIKNVRLTSMTDDNTMLNAFKAGNVDMIALTGEQMAGMKAQGQPVTAYADGGVQYLEYNTKRTALGLNNAKIRTALGIALDTKSLCSNVLKNGSTPAEGFVPPTVAGANGSLYATARGSVRPACDTAKAKTLLDAGLKEAGLTKDSLKLSLTCSDNSKIQRTAQFLQEQWKTALGITVSVKPMPSKNRFADMDAGNFDIVLTNWYPDYNDPMTYLNTLQTGNGNNSGKYSNAAYDALINTAVNESNVVKRQQELIDAEKMAMADCPVYPLFFSALPYTTSAKLTGLTRTTFQDLDVCDGAKIG